MKAKVIILALALSRLTGQLMAQDGNAPGEERRPPPREGGRRVETEPLTDAQKQQVKAILSKFDPATLTADQAKSIHETFRQAGLRGGPAMADTIKSAGFDPDKLRDLAPPPDADRDRNDRRAR